MSRFYEITGNKENQEVKVVEQKRDSQDFITLHFTKGAFAEIATSVVTENTVKLMRQMQKAFRSKLKDQLFHLESSGIKRAVWNGKKFISVSRLSDKSTKTRTVKTVGFDISITTTSDSDDVIDALLSKEVAAYMSKNPTKATEVAQWFADGCKWEEIQETAVEVPELKTFGI